MSEEKETIIEGQGGDFKVRLEVLGEFDERDIPALQAIVSLVIGVAQGMKEFGSAYGLQVGVILGQAARMVQGIYNMFKAQRGFKN